MNIVFLCHPDNLDSRSMPRYAAMLANGMADSGHIVNSWAPPKMLSRLFRQGKATKWARYFDSFLVFPLILRFKIARETRPTLYVLTDQALGMWMCALKGKPHVVHCHDFLAIKSARGEYPENRTRLPGKIYQALIVRGVSRASAFISISYKTQSDLHRILGLEPKISGVVYNALPYPFTPIHSGIADASVRKIDERLHFRSYILHIGGNQWYKNKIGVIEAYLEYSRCSKSPKRLVMVGAPPPFLTDIFAKNPDLVDSVCVIPNISDHDLNCLYSNAALLFFPSLEEGFGWPIAEAMASGCLVVTTAAAPMTEVGLSSAHYVARREEEKSASWAVSAAAKINDVIAMPEADAEETRNKGILLAARFTALATIPQYEAIYRDALVSTLNYR